MDKFITYLRQPLPKSYAAHAYNNLSMSLQRYTIIRICSFWDSYGLDRKSIPTIASLLNTAKVANEIFKEQEDWHNNLVVNTHYLNPDPDPEIQASIVNDNVNRGKIDAKKLAINQVQKIKKIRKKANVVANSKRYAEFKKFRDHTAHNLESESQKSDAAKINLLNEIDYFRDEAFTLVNELYLYVCGVGYDFEEESIFYANSSRSLWRNCKFNIDLKSEKET